MQIKAYLENALFLSSLGSDLGMWRQIRQSFLRLYCMSLLLKRRNCNRNLLQFCSDIFPPLFYSITTSNQTIATINQYDFICINVYLNVTAESWVMSFNANQSFTQTNIFKFLNYWSFPICKYYDTHFWLLTTLLVKYLIIKQSSSKFWLWIFTQSIYKNLY